MDVRRTGVQELRRGIERDEVVVLDARRVDAWEASGEKIPGALRVEPDDVEAVIGRLPPGRAIVAYCT